MIVKGKSHFSFNGFIGRHPVIANFVAVCIVAALLCAAAFIFLNHFTQHGKYYTVPDVRQLPATTAVSALEAAGFKCEITDSIYNEAYPLGSVIEQAPKANADAKAGRTVYLSINASSPRLVAFPSVLDMSLRQGESILHSYGFKNITVVYSNSPFKDLILEAKADNRATPAGTKLSLSARITLTVGNGIETEEADSLESIGQETAF